MGEAKDRENAAKAAAEAAAKEQKELQDLLNTPLTKEEAEKAFADADVNRAQILVARQKLISRQDAHRLALAEAQRAVAEDQRLIDECDESLASISLARNIIYRRALNPVAAKPVMGEPVKTN